MTDMKKKNLEYYFWPWGLVAVIVLFVLALLISLFASTMNRSDLVTEYYYAEGIEYQAKMEVMEASLLPENAISLRYDSGQELVHIQFPARADSAPVEGTIKFFRPSQATLDREFSVNPDSSGLQSISTSELIRGNWRIQVSWTLSGQEFYSEQSIVIE